MIKISSWNVNGIRAVERKGNWSNFLNEINPDIICLQEIKANKDQIDFFDKSYFAYINSAEKAGYSGTAILSKSTAMNSYINFDYFNKFKEVDLIDNFGNLNKEGRITTVEYEKFFLISVYTPNAKDDLSRLNLKYKFWDPVFLEYIKELDSIKPVILAGDLNVANEEIDLFNPKNNKGKKGFTDQEREGFKRILSAGFIDSFRYFNKNGNNYTWWSHFANSRERNVGWRIDYIIVSDKLRSNLKSASIDKNILGSDHCPVSIILDI